MFYNSLCAGFSDLATKLVNFGPVEELTGVSLDKRDEILKKLYAQDSAMALQLKNFRNQYQFVLENTSNVDGQQDLLLGSRYITLLYGGFENFEVMEAFWTTHPEMLEEGQADREDLERLRRHVADPRKPLEASTSTETTILLVEHWRLIPEVAQRREVAKELFYIYFNKVHNNGPYLGIRNSFLKDVTRYLDNNQLSSFKEEAENKIDSYLTLQLDLEISAELKKAFDFLFNEMIDILSQMRRFVISKAVSSIAVKTNRIVPSISDNEMNTPFPIIITTERTYNFTVTYLLQHTEKMGLDANPEKNGPAHYFFHDEKAAQTFYARVDELTEDELIHFEPEQCELILLDFQIFKTNKKNNRKPQRGEPMPSLTKNSSDSSISLNSTGSSTSSSPVSSGSSTPEGSSTPPPVEATYKYEVEAVDPLSALLNLDDDALRKVSILVQRSDEKDIRKLAHFINCLAQESSKNKQLQKEKTSPDNSRTSPERQANRSESTSPKNTSPEELRTPITASKTQTRHLPTQPPVKGFGGTTLGLLSQNPSQVQAQQARTPTPAIKPPNNTLDRTALR